MMCSPGLATARLTQLRILSISYDPYCVLIYMFLSIVPYDRLCDVLT